ncbi:MAG: hypothetical protein R3202_03735, partial [Candidatus Competibacterales bacterium]|nr:hypothetical protein [Candidatus Competibacterales bacterium]
GGSREGVLGLQARADYRIDPDPRFGPLSLGLAADLFLQRPDSDSGEWSATLRGSLGQRRDRGPKTWHLPALGFWARHLSLDRNPFRPGTLDQDVFTPYKAQHRHGLSLSETFYHRPWLDTLWYAGLGLATNENLDPLDPDHVQARIGWRQLLGDWQVDAEYRLRRYRADGDRSDGSTQRRLRLDLDWNGWERDQDRWQVHLSWEHDFDRDDGSWLLRFEWHGGAGRGLRDFRPAELDFEDLRRRRIPQTLNNAVEDADLE